MQVLRLPLCSQRSALLPARSLEVGDGSSGSAHLLTAPHRSVKWQHPVTPCRKLLQSSTMGDIKCRLPRPGVAFASAVIANGISIITQQARRRSSGLCACPLLERRGVTGRGAARLQGRCCSSPSSVLAAARVAAQSVQSPGEARDVALLGSSFYQTLSTGL